MKKDQRKAILFLAYIGMVFLFANFFHTETTFEISEYCPICQWQHSVYSPEVVCLVIISVGFIFLYWLGLFDKEYLVYEEHSRIRNRAPPTLVVSS